MHTAVGRMITEEHRNEAACRAADHTRVQRDLAERLLALASHLDPPQRDLLEQVYGKGTPVAAIARILGVAPGRLRARLRRIVTRLRDPLCRFVLGRAECWPPPRRDIALRWFVRGHSMRAIARDGGLTLHFVRREIQVIRLMFEFEQSGRTAVRRDGPICTENGKQCSAS